MAKARTFRLLSRVVQKLPWGAIRPLGALGGWAMWATQPKARATSLRHAARFRSGNPTAVTRQDRQVARRRFLSYGRYFLETLWLRVDRQDAIVGRMELEGEHRLNAALADGKGVVLAVGHVGNWDYAAVYPLSLGSPVIAVAEVLEDSEMTEWFIEMRARAGIEIVLADGSKGSFLSLVRGVKQGRVVALLCDRDVTGAGVDVTFFGEQTSLPGGPVALAAATGAPVLPVVCQLTKDGHRFIVGPAMAFGKSDLGDAMPAAMASVAEQLEQLLRRKPEQWHVLQPNWPSDPGYSR